MHAVYRFHKAFKADFDSWLCEKCDFSGGLWEAIGHAVRSQFIVR
jgi:hypothetical protein